MHIPSKKRLAAKRRVGGALRRLSPAVATFLSTLLALPASAGITVPTDPLTTASRVPPNVLFILDNSGSMAYTYMPDTVPATSAPDVSTYAYTRNTLSYNPAVTYQPWTKADGSLMTGGTSYSSVYSDPQYVDYSATGPTGTGTVSTSGGTKNLYDSVQTFYVPKDTTSTSSTYLADGKNYYRYQILTNGRVQQGVYGTVANSNLQTVGVSGAASGTLNNNNATTLTLANVSAGVLLDIAISNTTTGNQSRDLNYVVQNPSSAQIASGTVTRGNSTTYTVSPTVSGQYKVVLTRASNNNTSYSVSASRYDSTNSCDSGASNGSQGWINCTYKTPTGRTEAAEQTNYATWYSYHRTRTKAAKAGASQAFAGLGSDARVGFRTIWNDSSISTSGNMPSPSVPIPVSYNDGLFTDTGTTGNANAYNNRTQWYNRLFTTTGSSSTPLRNALNNAGAYFSDSAATGPYGPATGTSQLACRQNFTILTTDGYWNEDNTKDSTFTSTAIGDADSTAGSSITSPTGASYTYDPTASANSAYPGGLAKDGKSTLADIAMYYWKKDLRTDAGMDNVVPTSSSDPAFWQHMTTFTIGLGLVGTVNQTSVAAVLANKGATYTSGNSTYNGWPQPVNNSITAVDDLLHAAVNGHGTYVAASNPSEFTTGLKAALAAVSERTGSFSNVSATSSKVTTDTQIFHASYVSNVWTGELLACPINGAGTCNSTNKTWAASAGVPAYGSRKIFTYNTTATAAPYGTTFPTAAQTAVLARTTTPAVTAADNAAYIAGDKSKELANGGTLRNRTTLLGDIVSSSPVYSADAKSVFVGANDGMLHAFSASTGAEQFAYIPGGINVGSLATLSDTAYSHRYFVDGPIVVSTQKQTAGKNILVGSLGRGGKGLYALDVSSPASFSASSVLWERSETSGGNMGLILGKPIIAKLNSGVTALIVSNGVNSSHDRAVLLVYNLETGALLREIDTGSGSATSPNGLAEAVGWNADGDRDSNGNGTVEYVYAGDMLGHVWKFDLSSTNSGAWGVANGSDPVFTAVNSSGQVQPITSGLAVGMNPKTYKTWVFFGTGRFITTGDTTDKTVQGLYGFEVDGGTVTRADLEKQTVAYVTTSDGYKVRTFESNAPLAAGKKGWYIDLVAPPNPPGTVEGERVVSAAQISGSNLVVSSIVPTADACQSDGTGYLNALDAFTGTSVSSPYFDVDGDGKASDDTVTYTDPSTGKQTTAPIGSVNLGIGMITLANLMTGGGGGGKACVSGSSGGMGCVGVSESRKVGRVSWREVIKGN